MSGFHLRIKFLRNLPRWRERDERGELQSRRLTFTMQCGGRRESDGEDDRREPRAMQRRYGRKQHREGEDGAQCDGALNKAGVSSITAVCAVLSEDALPTSSGLKSSVRGFTNPP